MVVTALLLGACASTSESVTSETSSDARDASLYAKPFRTCVQNLTSQPLAYEMYSGKKGTLGTNATECMISRSSEGSEVADFWLTDNKDGSEVMFRAKNKAVQFAWITCGWCYPKSSEVVEFEPGVSRTVPFHSWNVTTLTDGNVKNIGEGKEGYHVDFRISDG